MLYLALEDSDRRMQSRIRMLGDVEPAASENFVYFTTRQPIEEGGLALLDAWAKAHEPKPSTSSRKMRTPAAHGPRTHTSATTAT